MSRTAIRTLILQAVILVGIALVIATIAKTTFANLDRLGVQSGFDFLWYRSGFDIGQKLLPYSSNSPIYMAFFVSVLNTLLLSFFSILLATLLGLIIALLRISDDWFLNGVGCAFVEVFRNVPALLQIFFWYFIVLRSLPSFEGSFDIFNAIFINNRGIFLPSPQILPSLINIVAGVIFIIVLARLYLRRAGKKAETRKIKSSHMGTATALVSLVVFIAWMSIAVSWHVPSAGKFGYSARWVISPEFAALILGISFYNAAYVAEVIRAGFRAVPQGQWEAARSMGMSYASTMRRIIIPQAMRIIVPPMTNCYLNIFKASSLGAAIGYPEIVSVMVGTTNNLVGRPVEIMFLTFTIYSAISLVGVWLMKNVNDRFNRFKIT